MNHRRRIVIQPEKVFTTKKAKVEDTLLLELIEVYPLKTLKSLVEIPNNLYPILIDMDNRSKVINIANSESKLKKGYTPSELMQENNNDLVKLHHKLNLITNMEEQVYCSDKNKYKLKDVVKLNKILSLDILANEIKGIFQNNNNLRQFCQV